MRQYATKTTATDSHQTKSNNYTHKLMLIVEQEGRQLCLYKLAGTPNANNEREEPSLLLMLAPALEKEVVTADLSPDGEYPYSILLIV